MTPPSGRFQRRFDPRHWLSDLLAGIVVGAVTVPINLAYGTLAGVPVAGLYAGILPILVYALLGSSRQMIVTADAALATVVALSLAPLAGGDPARLMLLASATALLAGGICLLGHLLRLGFAADLLSKPVMVGFNHGLAVVILLSQLPKLLGLPSPHGGSLEMPMALWQGRGSAHLLDLGVGLGSIALILGCRRFAPRVPGQAIALLAAVLLTYFFALDRAGVVVVSAVPAGLPTPMLPWLSWEDARAILPVALAVSLLTFSDSTIIARAFAARNRYRINANRELLALGAANIAAGLTQALPVGASGSRTAVLEASGGRSQTAALVAAVVVIACLVFLTDFFRFLPAAALAGILITAALSLIDLEEFRRIWRFGRIGLVGALLTLAGVVAYGMIEGIALGVLFSMLNLLHSLAFPDDAVLGEHTTGDYADLALSPPPRSVAGLLIYRFGAPLIFVNSGRFRDRIEQLIEEAPSEVRGVIVDASQMLRIDLAAAELLVEIGQDLADRGIRFALCCANPQVEAALKKLDLNAPRPPLTIHANIAGARVMLLGDRASTD